MVRTWIGDIRPLLQESCYRRYWRRLPDFRQEKAEKYRFQEGRALSVGVWVLWQRAREEYALEEDAPFNLSHSGCYALCSAETQEGSQAQVGCDVQQIGSYQEAIARRFFCPKEYADIKGQEGPHAKKELFFRYWVLKESFIKATRQGMAMELDSFCFRMEEGAYPALEACPAPYQSQAYHFREFCLESYRAAVCSTDPQIDTRLHWVEF